MANAMFTEPRFTNEDAARAHLEALRWPRGPICPQCGGVERNSRLNGKSHRPGLLFCGDCRRQFTVTVGTVFERSKVPLHKWVLATHLMCSSKKGISSHQLHRTLGVTYKTAWFMAHRIREAMGETPDGQLGGPNGNTVEVDETYWGNKKRKQGAFKHIGTRGAGPHHQMKIVSLVERGGKVRSFHFRHVLGSNVRAILGQHIAADSIVHTDESALYKPINRMFTQHETVNHSRKEYSRGNVTTNAVENFFSILKRGLVGTFHHVGEQHLFRYMKEFDFRYNTRTALGVNDAERTDHALIGISNKRLTYRRPNRRTAA
jgi:transposase-like protein